MKKLILFFILTNLSYAEVSKVIFLKGELFINNKLARNGFVLNWDDEVKTGKRSLAVLAIYPGVKVKLKSNTSIVINKPIKQKKIRTFSYFIKQGEMFIKANRTKENRYSVETKNAVMGVRGTEFFVSTQKKVESKDWMCVNKGQVEVKIAKGSVLVNAGEGVAISKEKVPAVKKYKWTKRLNWKMEGLFSEIEDHTNIQNLNYDLENINYD